MTKWNVKLGVYSISVLFIVATVDVAFPHTNHHAADHHGPGTPETDKLNKAHLDAMKKCQDAYRAEIEPIFKAKCFDCHSSSTRHPWYYKVPGVRQLINSDVKEAKEHLDMSQGFPFQGHTNKERA